MRKHKHLSHGHSCSTEFTSPRGAAPNQSIDTSIDAITVKVMLMGARRRVARYMQNDPWVARHTAGWQVG